MRLSVVLGLLLCASPAAAQLARDETWMRAGVELRRAHRDEEALAHFTRAYGQTRSPVAQAQMGLAEQALGRWVEAEEHVRRSLEAATDPWILRNREALRGALSVIEQHLGRIWIDGGIAGAEVIVDDRSVTTLPMAAPVRVVAGTLTLQVRAPGYESVFRPVTVAAGGEAREVVRLTRIARPGGPMSSEDRSALVATRAHPEVTSTLGGTQRVLGWSSMAGGLLGLGIGVAARVVREGAVDEYNNQALCPGRSAAFQPGDCQSLVDRVESMELLSTIGLVAGGALAVTSVVLLATASSPRRGAEGGARIGCIVGPGTLGLQCAGRF